MLYIFKVKKLGTFLAYGQYRTMGLICFVTSFQCFIHVRNKSKERDTFLIFTECLIHVLFLDVTTKVTLKMVKICIEYPFFNDHRPEWVRSRKKMDWFCNLSLLMLVLWGKENPEMVSQSKLDPFSWIVESTKLPCFEKVQHLKEKSRAKDFFAGVKRAVGKVYLCEKNYGG